MVLLAQVGRSSFYSSKWVALGCFPGLDAKTGHCRQLRLRSEKNLGISNSLHCRVTSLLGFDCSTGESKLCYEHSAKVKPGLSSRAAVIWSGGSREQLEMTKTAAPLHWAPSTASRRTFWSEFGRLSWPWNRNGDWQLLIRSQSGKRSLSFLVSLSPPLLSQVWLFNGQNCLILLPKLIFQK